MKRIIFTFLYENDQFILSRNFSRQRIGNERWLFENYNLEKVAYSLDEIMLLNISPSNEFDSKFYNLIEKITKNCFVPITVGGRIYSENCAEKYFRSGADKILINNLNFVNPKITQNIIDTFGSQAVMACVNYKSENEEFTIFSSDGKSKYKKKMNDHLNFLLDLNIGEVLFQSINNDGTGVGLDFSILKEIPKNFHLPLVIMGGVGKKDHVIEGLLNTRIDAVATANILNFIGSSIINLRIEAIKKGVLIPAFNEFNL